VTDTQRAVAREKAREITARMRTDPNFIKQLQEDPRGTLAAAGMPADVLDEAVAGLGLDADVEGHGRRLTAPQSIWAMPDQSIWAEAQEDEKA
jgi:hypothetical protein